MFLAIRPGVVPASLVGTLRPGRDSQNRAVACRSVALAARRLSFWPVLLRSRLLREAVPPPGLQSPAAPRCSPEATALPGGGAVRGHTPNSRTRDAAAVPE